jgi:hypothetical protein
MIFAKLVENPQLAVQVAALVLNLVGTTIAVVGVFRTHSDRHPYGKSGRLRESDD